MDSQPVSTPAAALFGLASHEPAQVFTTEPPSQELATQQVGDVDSVLEPGEIPVPDIKQEANAPDNGLASSLFVLSEHSDPNACQSPLAHVAVKSSPVNPFQLCWQPGSQSASNGIPRLTTAVQRRNHARLSEIVTRLQNFSGSVTELLAIASVQQQLDTAFADLNRAENQLKEVFRQFELQGHISKRQGCKQNCATRDLAKASQRIVQLTKELWDLQRRG